jgi:transcriptional regulator with XRE-family HTH domain
MPTIEQIRAARALLGWSQHDLAEKADLSQTGIARIENGTNQPNTKTIEKIKAAFDIADIEFIGSSGVKKRTDEIKILKGAEGLRELVEDIYVCTKHAIETTNQKEALVYLYNARPENWHKWLGKDWWDMHAKRMSVFGNKVQRIIASENNNYFISDAFSEHRGFPENLFNDQSIYAYENKLAFVTFGDDVSIKILKNKEFCDGFKVLFNIAWEHVAKPMKI